MRRPGQWHLGDGALEDNAIASQGVQGWGLHVGRAVAAEVIGAEGVDGDKYHVRGRTPGRDGGRQTRLRAEPRSSIGSWRMCFNEF